MVTPQLSPLPTFNILPYDLHKLAESKSYVQLNQNILHELKPLPSNTLHLPELKQLPSLPLNVPSFPNFNKNRINKVVQGIPSINISPHLLQKLNKDANINPIKTLLKEAPKFKLPSENISSIITGIIALIGLIACGFSLYYVFKQSPTLSANSTGIIVLENPNLTTVTKLNTHYVCIIANGTMTLALPFPELHSVGQYMSFSFPSAIGDPVSQGTFNVIWNNDDGEKNLSISPNSGALLMIAYELKHKRWKLIRTWP